MNRRVRSLDTLTWDEAWRAWSKEWAAGPEMKQRRGGRRQRRISVGLAGAEEAHVFGRQRADHGECGGPNSVSPNSYLPGASECDFIWK